VRRSVLIAIALLVPALTQWLVRELQVVLRTELLFYDWHVGALPNNPPDDRLVFVGMDDESLSRLPLDRPAYPLPRSMHAKVVRELHEAGAKLIAFDVMFTTPIPSEDAMLADAMEQSKPVLCGAEPSAVIVNGEELIALSPPAPLLLPHVTACALNTPRRFGRVRWLLPSVVDANTSQRYTHMSVALAESLGGKAEAVPVGPDGEIFIRFIGPPGSFKPVSYHEVFNGTWRQSRGPDFFQNKTVLIGAVGPLVDHILTPVGEMQGTEVLLQAAQSIAAGNWIRHWSAGANYVLKCALSLLLVVSIWKFGARRAFMVFLAEAAVWIFLAHRAFVSAQVWVDTFEPVVASMLTLGVASAYEAGRVRRVFHRFMPSSVAEKMLESSPQEAAATKEVEASVVFCDVRSSTKLAELLPSETIEELLRRYFVAGEESAVRLGTELDKFVGDEIMLYFEERRGLEDHAVRAVRWAFDIQQACREITASGLAGETGFRVGVGIATGPVRIGIVGAKRRIQHTVIGDTVNTASRVQSLTKDFDEPIIISENTRNRVSQTVECDPIGEVPIRGKEKPMKLFKPVRFL
jgi:adenylate cyclase